MAAKKITCDVAIVGAGPVGATLAALLGQAGLNVFVGDAATEVYPLPRAAHFDHEVMRIFQQLGIVEAIESSITPADRYVFQNGHGDVLLDFDLSLPTETGWKGYMMHQPGIETAIRERLSDYSHVQLALGATFEDHCDDGKGVNSRWRIDDRTVDVRSRFLVGCDGAWSPVRTGAEIELEDLCFDEPWLVLDVEVGEVNSLPEVNTQYCDPVRPTTYIIMGNDRRRFEFMLKPGETSEEMLSDVSIARLLQPWDTQGLRRVERSAVYRFHALVARKWRKGRVLLAGDAAHQMPPFAGQGMCSGIRDAAALAWRLALAGEAGDGVLLLDSYQAERDPHVRAITHAAIETGRVVCTLDPKLAAERDAQMLAGRAAGAPMPDISSPNLIVQFGLPGTPRSGERFIQPVAEGQNENLLRMDDVLGPGAWLIGHLGTAVLPRCPGLSFFQIDDMRLEPFKAAIDEWLRASCADAVLVRADHYVFGTGEPANLVRAFQVQSGLVQESTF